MKSILLLKTALASLTLVSSLASAQDIDQISGTYIVKSCQTSGDGILVSRVRRFGNLGFEVKISNDSKHLLLETGFDHNNVLQLDKLTIGEQNVCESPSFVSQLLSCSNEEQGQFNADLGQFSTTKHQTIHGFRIPHDIFEDIEEKSKTIITLTSDGIIYEKETSVAVTDRNPDGSLPKSQEIWADTVTPGSFRCELVRQ